MRPIAYIVILVILTNCQQPKNEQKNNQKTSISTTVKSDIINKKKEKIVREFIEKNNNQNESLNYEFKKAILFKLTDTIFADFNGDSITDLAIFSPSGIIIQHGETNKEIRIGFGKSFAHLKSFRWVHYWGLVNDSETYEILIENTEITNEKTVKLDNPSIVVRREEEGGGLITFKNGKYKWVHQAD